MFILFIIYIYTHTHTNDRFPQNLFRGCWKILYLEWICLVLTWRGGSHRTAGEELYRQLLVEMRFLAAGLEVLASVVVEGLGFFWQL